MVKGKSLKTGKGRPRKKFAGKGENEDDTGGRAV